MNVRKMSVSMNDAKKSFVANASDNNTSENNIPEVYTSISAQKKPYLTPNPASIPIQNNSHCTFV